MNGGYRKAALSLQGLDPSDREWILGRLKTPEQARLREMLDELGKLGVPEGDRSFSEFMALHEDRRSLEPDFVRQIRHADAESVKAIFRNESESVVAVVLSYQDWPWKTEVLKTYPSALRRKLEARAAACRDNLSERVATSILRSMAMRLGNEARPLPVPGISPPRNALFAALFKRLQWRK